MLGGADQRFFLPASALAGAMLSATSVLSKMLIPGAILPVSVVTALVGVPFFVVLIFSNKGARMMTLSLHDVGARLGAARCCRASLSRRWPAAA